MAPRRIPQQDEIPGTESLNRDPELHALGLEVITLEAESKDAKRRENAKRAEAGEALRKRGLKEYNVDDVSLWIEGKETVKARREGDRPKGKVRKVVVKDEEE